MRTRHALVGAFAALLSTAAIAAPPPAGPGPGQMQGERERGPNRQQREQMLRKVHTNFVIELGQILELDTAGTIKLADRLKKYDDQRVQLHTENWDLMEQLRRAGQEGGARVDAASIARKLAANRVALAQLDQRELEDVLTGLPPEKAQKVAVFVAEYPHKVMRMAKGMMGGGRGGRGGERGPGGWE